MSKLLFLFFVVSGVLSAQIQMDPPKVFGQPCPEGSVAATLSDDQSQLSILFDQFVVNSKAPSPRKLGECWVSVIMHVPSDYALTITGIDYRGFASVPRDLKVSLTTQNSFVDRKGKMNIDLVKDAIKGPSESDFYFNQKFKWESQCGSASSLNLKISLQILNQNNSIRPSAESAMASLDSADISHAPVQYKLQLKKCRNR